MRQYRIWLLVWSLGAGLALLTSGCGTTVGNGLNNVTLSSSAYNSPTVWNTHFLPLQIFESLMSHAFASTITSFKFCATGISLEDDQGDSILNPDDSNAPVFPVTLGLVDLGDGTASISWGNGQVPSSASIKLFKVEIEKSPQTCSGANYSVSINGQTITEGTEFKFAFTTAQTVPNGKTITFSMANLVTLFSQAIQAGAFNDQSIGTYFDSSDSSKDGEGSAD